MKTTRIEELLEVIQDLKRGEVGKRINSRIREFKKVGEASSNEIFKELCFCILTANFNAERAIRVQNEIGNGFLSLTEDELRKRLKSLGYRFPSSRARYITQARKYKDSLKGIAGSFNEEIELREWLVKNVKGIGYKEASHFLRNIGYTDLAILDFHVINLLASCGIAEKPKTLTKRRYLEIENLLREIARKTNLNLAALDLYLWYLETGKILK